MTDQEPAIVYGAVYFRKSNPPPGDWERDYAVASSDGMNTFRHWFMWSAIEIAPGVYDWGDYDRQLDLAARHGIKTIIAEQVTFAPEWAFRELAGSELRTSDGRKAASSVSPSSATGGHPGLCLDHREVRAAAERFLVALADRYKDHPALGGFDIWNECNLPEQYCYCEETAKEFRRWLEARYGSLRALAETWNRYSLTAWEDVRPPPNGSGYAESLDWRQFRIEHAYERMRWRADLFRRVDGAHPVTAHGIAASLSQMAGNAADDWRAAAEVDTYGYTWVASRKGSEPWKQWSAVDLVRSASRGKNFWHAEMQGGPLWLQPQVLGRPRSDGRIAEPEDIRLWNLVSFGGGARGALYPRWRPLLDGPLYGAFGPYGMAGERTDRSAMAARIATWANAAGQRALWSARPVRGELGIVVVPETQLFVHVQRGTTDPYTEDVWGVYRGFFDLNLQADYVHIDHIDEYRTLYLPIPVMLSSSTCGRLAAWVEAGGTLISEGCPGYFGDHGHVGVVQPNGGLDAVFGALEADVEFAPDLLEQGEDRFSIGGSSVVCGAFRQSYELAGGEGIATYEDGRIAAVVHRRGEGRTLLVGTCVGSGYHRSIGTSSSASWFSWLREWAGIDQHVRVGAAGVTARLQQGAEGVWLWVTNPHPEPREVELELGTAWGPCRAAEVCWGAPATAVEGRRLSVEVGGRDALIARLELAEASRR